jgi:WD40 repeat protein
MRHTALIAALIGSLLVLNFSTLSAASSRAYFFLASNPDGSLIAGIGMRGLLHIRNAANGELVADLSISTPSTLSAVKWSPDGTVLAVGDGNGVLRLFCTDTTVTSTCNFGDLIRYRQAHSLDVRDLEWSPDGTQIVTGSQNLDDSIRLWNASDLELLEETGNRSPSDLAWNPVYPEIAFADMNSAAGVINSSALDSYTRVGVDHAASAVAWNSSGDMLAIAYGSLFFPGEPINIVIWNSVSGQIIATLNGHTDVIGAVAWSASDDYLVSVGFDLQVIIWDATTWSLHARFDSTECGGISPLSIDWLGDADQVIFGGGENVPPTVLSITHQTQSTSSCRARTACPARHVFRVARKPDLYPSQDRITQQTLREPE